MRQSGWRLSAVALMGAATLALLLFGCGDDKSITSGFDGFENETAEMSIDLGIEDGGVGTSAEQPGFGESYFDRYLQGGEPVVDALNADPRMNPLERRPGTSVQYLRVTWGNLRRGPEAVDDTTRGPVLDWSGKAVVSDGLLLPLQVLRFERGDFLVRPTKPEPGQPANRQVVEWVSKTAGAWDGVLLKIVVPPAGDSTFAAYRLNVNGDGLTVDDLFTFDTELLDVSFPLNGIADLDTVILLDEENGVSFTGFSREDVELCPRGALVGAWVKVDTDSANGGFFRAVWEGPLGDVRGHLRGRWGVLEDGTQAFVGKIIDRKGGYAGFVRGTWEADAADPTQGTFHGIWKRRAGDGPPAVVGTVRGVWGLSDRIREGWTPSRGVEEGLRGSERRRLTDASHADPNRTRKGGAVSWRPPRLAA